MRQRVFRRGVREAGLFRRPIAEGGAEAVRGDIASLHPAQLHRPHGPVEADPPGLVVREQGLGPALVPLLEDVEPDLRELFEKIPRFEAMVVNIEPKFRPFIPDYLPAVGDIDPYIKNPRPDGKQDHRDTMGPRFTSLRQSATWKAKMIHVGSKQTAMTRLAYG